MVRSFVAFLKLQSQISVQTLVYFMAQFIKQNTAVSTQEKKWKRKAIFFFKAVLMWPLPGSNYLSEYFHQREIWFGVSCQGIEEHVQLQCGEGERLSCSPMCSRMYCWEKQQGSSTVSPEHSQPHERMMVDYLQEMSDVAPPESPHSDTAANTETRLLDHSFFIFHTLHRLLDVLFFVNNHR